MDRTIINNNTTTTTCWNINQTLDCIPMWPLAFPLQQPPLHGQDQPTDGHDDANDDDEEELGAMKEMMYKIAAMQPVDIDPAAVRRPRRRNVRISDDPQSVAARHRRERISEKMRILQRLVPGGTKMDTASMLDEAIRYVKFLKRQIRHLHSDHHNHPPPPHPLFVSGDTLWPPDKATPSSSGTLIGHNIITRSLSYNNNHEVIN